MRSSRVEVHIEELVLRGFSPLDRHAVADAVRRELAARVTAESPRTFASADAIDAGTFEASPAADARALGAGIGRQLGKALR